MADTLDIEELNRTRIALGMAPIPVNNGTSNLNFKKSGSDEDEEEDLGSTLESREALGFDNWKRLQDEATEKKKKEERRAALKKERDAAQRNTKLEGKGLGDAGDDDMDTRAWLLGTNKRQKKVEKARALALQQELLERENQAQYTEKDLAGIKVGHELGDFDEDVEQIITLKDTAVDAEDDEDVLENADLRAKEQLTERLQLKKKKPVYDPHEVDESGERRILAQYDEEIDGKKQKRFTLNGQGRTVEDVNGAGTESTTKSQGMKFSLDSLLGEEKPVSDYMDISEVKIRKPKKKKEKSKKQKAEDDMFDVDEAQASNQNDMQIDVPGGIAEAAAPSAKRRREDTSFVDDQDLQSNLAMQRRATLKKRKMTRPEEIARQLREEVSATPTAMDTAEDTGEDGGLVIDETSEFVANLQKPEAAPQRTSTKKSSTLIKTERATALTSPTPKHEDSDSDVEMDHHNDGPNSPPEASAPTETLTATGLDAEEVLTNGLGSTLSMLTQRGLLKTATTGDINAQHRERQRFLHEKQQRESEASTKARLQRERDRASGKFERMSAREREQYAQWENKARDQYESRAMADVFNREYRPNVELKYVDEHGRHMDQREAFKHLSHQFHGKGSGKQKTEKRIKKIEEEKKRESLPNLDAGASASAGLGAALGTQARKQRTAGVRLQ